MQRIAALLADVDGLSIEAIASTLSVDQATVARCVGRLDGARRDGNVVRLVKQMKKA